MQQAQQPLEGEHPDGVGVGEAQRPVLADLELRVPHGAAHRYREVGQHECQKTLGPPQCFTQVAGAEHAAAEEFEGTRSHREREQAETFVGQGVDYQVVEPCIAVDRDSGGRVCKLDAGCGEQRCRVATVPEHAEHAAHETRGNGGGISRASGGIAGARRYHGG